MNSISDSDGKIDRLIKEARDKNVGEAKRREIELEKRREAALRKIASFALQHGIVDTTLELRINEASAVRVSQTEAYAVLAGMGDFTSPIMWWDIKVGPQSLWKGYVVKRRVFRKRVDVGSHFVEVNVRRVISETENWVAECYCDNGKFVSVGISDKNPEDAAVAALDAMCKETRFRDRFESFVLCFPEIYADPASFVVGTAEELTSEGA